MAAGDKALLDTDVSDHLLLDTDVADILLLEDAAPVAGDEPSRTRTLMGVGV